MEEEKIITYEVGCQTIIRLDKTTQTNYIKNYTEPQNTNAKDQVKEIKVEIEKIWKTIANHKRKNRRTKKTQTPLIHVEDKITQTENQNKYEELEIEIDRVKRDINKLEKDLGFCETRKPEIVEIKKVKDKYYINKQKKEEWKLEKCIKGQDTNEKREWGLKKVECMNEKVMNEEYKILDNVIELIDENMNVERIDERKLGSERMVEKLNEKYQVKEKYYMNKQTGELEKHTKILSMDEQKERRMVEIRSEKERMMIEERLKMIKKYGRIDDWPMDEDVVIASREWKDERKREERRKRKEREWELFGEMSDEDYLVEVYDETFKCSNPLRLTND